MHVSSPSPTYAGEAALAGVYDPGSHFLLPTLGPTLTSPELNIPSPEWGQNEDVTQLLFFRIRYPTRNHQICNAPTKHTTYKTSLQKFTAANEQGGQPSA